MVLLRSTVSCVNMYVIYFSLKYLNIGQWAIIFNCGPFFTLILSYFVLKEELMFLEVVNMVISFIGVVLIVLTSKNDTKISGKEPISTELYIFAVGMCFFGSICASFVGIIVKVIKNVHIHIVNAFYGYFLAIVSFIVWIVYKYIIADPF